MAEKVPDNPMGADFEAMSAEGLRYRTIQQVGPHLEATRGLSARDFGPGAQLQRLLDEGLIVREGEPDPPPKPGPRAVEKVPRMFRPENPEHDDPGNVASPMPRPIGAGVVVKPARK